MKCRYCKKKEVKEWIEVSPGCQRLIRICCEGEKIDKPIVGIKGFREPVAFGYDKKTGQPLAMDKKGQTFDPSDTRYNLERDRYGWGATGKIPKKKKYFT